MLKNEELHVENVRLMADFESEDEHQCDRKAMPSPNDGNEIWETVISPFKEERKVRGAIVYPYARFDIIRKMYENLVDRDIVNVEKT